MTDQILRRRTEIKNFSLFFPEETTAKETFGIKTRNCPPVIGDLNNFEEGLIKIIQSVKFKDIKCQF